MAGSTRQALHHVEEEIEEEEREQLSFSSFASRVALWCGSPHASGSAVALVLIWAISGPFFGFSENWQIVINTGTTIVTFLMVFIIQSSQNRDGMALQLKLDEIIRTLEGARNSLVDAENMDQKQLEQLRKSFRGLARECPPDELEILDANIALRVPKRAARKKRTRR